MTFERGADFLHVDFRLVVFRLHSTDLVARFAENREEAFVLLFIRDGAQLADEIREHLPHLAHVLGTDILQGGFREARNLLLGGGAVLQDDVGVGDVDGLGKVVHHFPFLRRQGGLVELDGNDGIVFDLLQRRLDSGKWIKGENRGFFHSGFRLGTPFVGHDEHTFLS